MAAFVQVSALLLAVATTAAADEPTLRSVAELDAFSADIRRRYSPFCITGTVQAVDAPSDNCLIVSDTSGWTEVCNSSACRPSPGDRVGMRGQAHMSAHLETDIVANEMDVVGTDAVEPPLELPLGGISEERHHLRTIITEGTVIDAFPDEIDSKYQFLILKDAENILPVAVRVNIGDAPYLKSLRDAHVRVRGRFMRTVSGSRKFSGPFIFVDRREAVAIIVHAPDDPFAAPPLERTPYRTPREIAKRGKRSASGEVLAVWGGNRVMLRAADGRIVNITLAHGQLAPRPGESATAVGYPETDLFRVNLSRAIVRTEPHAPAPRQELEITDLKEVFGGDDGIDAIDPGCHGRLMRVGGIVQSVPSPNAFGQRMLLTSGAFKLLVDFGDSHGVATDIEVGAELEVTGRCLLEIDTWNPDDIFPRIRNLVAVIRCPADIRIVARPPWWTPFRLLVVISVLVAALIGIYIWNRVLQKLANRRGHELYRERIAHAIAEFKTDERTRLAVELHDSLSQSLAGVACHVAACAKTMDRNPAVARNCIETADKMLGSCRTELRQCLFDLRSDTLEEPDFSAAIRKTLEQLDGNASIMVRFNVSRRRLKDTTAHAILAIVRELAGNAIRHGAATKVRVAGCMDKGRILLSVRDNGCGFDPASCGGPLQGHFGLEGIRNRLCRLGGEMTIKSEPGKGTTALVVLSPNEKD